MEIADGTSVIFPHTKVFVTLICAQTNVYFVGVRLAPKSTEKDVSGMLLSHVTKVNLL